MVCSRCGGNHSYIKSRCPLHPEHNTYTIDEDRKKAEKAIRNAKISYKKLYTGVKLTNDMNARRGSSRNGLVIQLMNHLKERQPIPTRIVDEFYGITGIKDSLNKCFWCKKELTKNRDREHIVPTCCTKKNVYGTNYVINIVPSCKTCNGEKSAICGEELRVFLRKKGWVEEKIDEFMTFIEVNKKWYQADESMIEMLEEQFLEINEFHAKMAKKIEDKCDDYLERTERERREMTIRVSLKKGLPMQSVNKNLLSYLRPSF